MNKLLQQTDPKSLVYEINLHKPVVYFWDENPKIKKYVVKSIEDLFPLGIKINGDFIYWWEIKSVHVWKEGKIVQTITWEDLFWCIRFIRKYYE